MPCTRGRSLPFASRDTTTNEVIQPIAKKPKADLGFKLKAQEIGFNRLKEIRASNGGQPKRGDMQQVVDEFSTTIFASVITYRMLRYRKTLEANGSPAFSNNNDDDKENNNDDETSESEQTNDINDDDTNNNNIVPTVTPTKVADYDVILNIVTKLYNVEYLKYHDNHQRVPKGTFEEIINRVTEEHGHPNKLIEFQKVWYRITTGNLTGCHSQRLSPIYDKERDVAEVIEELSIYDLPISKRNIISLASDMIRESIYQERMEDYKRKRQTEQTEQEENNQFVLGDGWYKGFCKRYKHRLQKFRAKHKDFKRRTWVTIEHFTNMYNYIYNQMVESGVAVRLENEIMYDAQGLVTEDKEKMVGRPTKYVLTHPEMVLFVDETGCNTNQRDGKNKDGRLHVRGKNNKGCGIQGATTDIPFTVLSFTAATGDAVMCAIILKSSKATKDLPITNTRGIDIMKDLVHGDNEVEVFRKNSGENSALEGGPKCKFQNKTIPCFVSNSPNASITSEMLAEMLKAIDSYHVFDRTNNKKPFLLLDGHGSRFQFPFVEYVKKSQTPWTVCFGVPYATHIWQVQDSNKLNGMFKAKMKDAKSELIEKRGEYKFKSTDVVPLVKTCFNQTFGNKANATKAIRERGWNPLNYACLDHIELKQQQENNENEQIVNNDMIEPLRPELDFDNDTVERPAYEKYISILYNMASRSKAMKKKWEDRQKQMINDETACKSIMELKGLTSGQMAANSHYSVTDDEVYKYLVRQRQENDNKRTAISEKQAALEEKNRKAWRQAYRNWQEEEKMFANDYRVLLKSVLMDNEVLPKKLVDLKRMFQRPVYQELVIEKSCEVYDSDDESTSTCDSDFTTDTRTDASITSLNNGEEIETELDVIEDLPASFQSEGDQNVPGEEQPADNNSVATAVLVHAIHNRGGVTISHTVESTTIIARDQNGHDEEDCNSVATAVLAYDIRYSVANTRRAIESKTGIDQSHDSSSGTFRNEMTDDSLVRALAGMRSDVRVEGVFDKTVVRE